MFPASLICTMREEICSLTPGVMLNGLNVPPTPPHRPPLLLMLLMNSDASVSCRESEETDVWINGSCGYNPRYLVVKSRIFPGWPLPDVCCRWATTAVSPPS